ncbi:PAS domain S-box protein [Nostoc sp. TCL26-01]|nr:PAS domain S-box protein [Nostoc sp. TCL26-01]
MDETIKLWYQPDNQQQIINNWEKVAANLPGIIFQFLVQQDGSQCAIYVSSGSRDLYELEPEVIQLDLPVFHKLIHVEDLTSFTESIALATDTIKPWHWQGRIVTPSGKVKWIHGASQLELQANGDILWDGLVMDITDHKQTQIQLQTTEARYQAILNAIPDLIFRLSRDGKYLDLQGEATNITCCQEEIIGRNLRDVLPADVAINAQEIIAKTLDTGTLQTCEYQLSTPLGMRDYEARLVVSSPDEVLAIVRDITERKQAESTLQNFAQKFSKAFNCSPDPITISTLHEGRFIEVNDSFVQLSGYGREETIGHTALELNIWVNEDDRLKLIQQLQTQGVIRNWEIAYRCKSGEIMTSLLSAEVIDLDGIPYILAVNHNITERKQTEAQLRLSAQRDRILAETLVRIRSSLNLEEILQTTVTEVRQFLQVDRVFIGISDDSVGIRTVAESVDVRYPSILGWTNKDQTYLQELKTIFTSNRLRVVEDVNKTAASPQCQAVYQQFQTKASLAVPIFLGDELFGAIVANQCSAPRNWQPIEIDLLQQMSEQLAIAIQQAKLYQKLADLNTNLEHQVEERTAQLQEKMRELAEMQRVKDVVLHTVAHDLRTSVIGNLMVLKNLQTGTKNPTSPSPQSPVPIPCSIIERMIQGNDRQLAMLDSLLEIHYCEEQGMTLQPELVPFGAFLERIVRDLQPIFSQNQATLENLVGQNLPLVMVDTMRLEKVLLNLFTHSLQHNPPGLNFSLKATVADGMIRTQIQDNGVTMSKLECDRLFDLYIRDPQAPCSTAISLKMYLSRQIIQAHGGKIGVTSNRQRGLTFWFTLPISNS